MKLDLANPTTWLVLFLGPPFVVLVLLTAVRVVAG